MPQQISESELVLMNIIWKNGGTALYSFIMEELEKEKMNGKKHCAHAAFPADRQKVSENKQNRQAQ